MIKYSNFLFSVIFRKASTYISIFFCLLVTFIFIYLSVLFNNNNDMVGIFPITLFTTWFPFVLSTMFVTSMVIRIFKIGEKDGTELLISAKPITRRQIIFGKFLVLFAMILILHGILFILYLILAFIDDKASNKWRILFATSMTLGGLIVTTISSSLIVIISSIIGKVGVAIISIIFSSCIPIASFIVIPAAKASSPLAMSRTLQANSLGDLYLMNKDKNNVYNSKEEIYSKGYNIIDNRLLLKINQNKKSWYKYASFADIWYQWGRLYSMFEPKVRPNQVLGIIAKKASIDVKNQNLFIKEHGIKLLKYSKLGYKAQNDYYFLTLFLKEEIELEKAKISNVNIKKYQNLVKKDGTFYQLFLTNKNKNEDDESWKILANELGLKTNVFEGNKSLLRILLYRLILDYQRNNPSNSALLETSVFPSVFYNHEKYYFSKVIHMEYEKNESQKNGYKIIRSYKEEPWLATIPVIIVWSFLALGLVGLSMLIYFKRDFR